MDEIPARCGKFDAIKSGFMVRKHPKIPAPRNSIPDSDIEFDFSLTAEIMVIGVGSFGARIAKTLAGSLADVACCEVTPDPANEPSEDTYSLLSSVQKSDFLFILMRADDEECSTIARTIGHRACAAGVPTFVVAPLITNWQGIPERSEGEEKWFDTLFCICDRALPILPDTTPWKREEPTKYLICHLITVITSVLTHRSAVGIAFEESVEALRAGRIGILGIGISSSLNRGGTTALDAIDRLIDQGVSLSEVKGVFASVYGSSQASYDDFDELSKVIAEQIPKPTEVVVGLVQDEQFWCDIEALVMVMVDEVTYR